MLRWIRQQAIKAVDLGWFISTRLPVYCKRLTDERRRESQEQSMRAGVCSSQHKYSEGGLERRQTGVDTGRTENCNYFTFPQTVF